MSREFIDFARGYGLLIERLIDDGKIHRCGTVEHPRSTNGSYKLTSEGDFGWVQPWDSPEGLVLFNADKPRDPARAAEFRRRADHERRNQQQIYQAAADTAQIILKRCTYASHPYFAKKGLYGHQGLVDIDGRLVVPMRHYATQDLQSVQWIDNDGGKLFLKGGRAKGAVFAIGPRFGTTWLCEGYATSLSIGESLKTMYRSDRIVCCFSAHNLKEVALATAGACYVLADNDKPDCYGRQAGQEAAKASGKPWVAPEVPGEDWNDVYARSGASAVAKLMRTLL